MAIVQISQITNRKGLNIDLPQPLAGGELGWSTDTRQLYIGNGTLAEGAPVVDNTEILTEFSDIIATTKYTYSGIGATGYAAQTGPTPSTPIQITQQAWMDQFASVLDFGAVGDGVTDDTDAINRALYQVYCVQPLEISTRRALFFPAGVYLVSDTINIPSYASIYGEGPDSTIILLESGSTAQYVAQYTDSAQQSGSSNPISNIRIANMQFQNGNTTTDVFLVQSATSCDFTNTAFIGSKGQGALTNTTDTTYAVQFDNSAQESSNIVFTDCLFAGTTFAINTDLAIRSVIIDKSEFNTLYQGVVLTATGLTGPTGVRITNSIFDNIFSSGVIIGAPGDTVTKLNATGYNTFYDVGNSFGSTPSAIIVGLYANNNVSIGDMFERDDVDALVYGRVLVDGQNVIAMTNGEQIEMGTYTRKSGLAETVPGSFTLNVSPGIGSFAMNYSIEGTGNVYRTGVFSVATLGGGPVNTSDDYTENAVSGITLSAAQVGNVVTVTTSGSSGVIYYSINYLN